MIELVLTNQRPETAQITGEQIGFDFGADAGKIRALRRETPEFVPCSECERPCSMYLKVEGCKQI